MNRGIRPEVIELEFSKLELLLSRDNKFFRFASLEFALRDVSVYIHLDAPTGVYFYGRDSIPPGQHTYSFNLANQHRTTDPSVHLSIHQSGQVHARVTRETSTAPVFTAQLPSFRGEHAATLMVDNMDGLRETAPSVGVTDGLYRYPIYVPENVHSARVVMYLNGHRPKFADECPILINIRRPNVGTVYLGMRPLPQERLGAPGVSGILALSGIKTVPAESPMDFVFLRGQ
jgi:hypothetical protein